MTPRSCGDGEIPSPAPGVHVPDAVPSSLASALPLKLTANAPPAMVSPADPLVAPPPALPLRAPRATPSPLHPSPVVSASAAVAPAARVSAPAPAIAPRPAAAVSCPFAALPLIVPQVRPVASLAPAAPVRLTTGFGATVSAPKVALSGVPKIAAAHLPLQAPAPVPSYVPVHARAKAAALAPAPTPLTIPSSAPVPAPASVPVPAPAPAVSTANPIASLRTCMPSTSDGPTPGRPAPSLVSEMSSNASSTSTSSCESKVRVAPVVAPSVPPQCSVEAVGPAHVAAPSAPAVVRPAAVRPAAVRPAAVRLAAVPAPAPRPTAPSPVFPLTLSAPQAVVLAPAPAPPPVPVPVPTPVLSLNATAAPSVHNPLSAASSELSVANPLRPLAANITAPTPRPPATSYTELSSAFLHELEYMLTEFRKLERQLQLGAEAAATRARAAALAAGREAATAGSGETPAARDRREKLGMFIGHLDDTVRQIMGRACTETEAKAKAAAAGLPSPAPAPEDCAAVARLERHILVNLLPVKSRLTKQLASNNAPAKPHHPTVMPHVAPRPLGTFAEAARARTEASQFGKPLNGGGSSLTQKLHGNTLGSTARKFGSGVGTADAAPARGLQAAAQYAGLAVEPLAQVPSAAGMASADPAAGQQLGPSARPKINLPLHQAAVAAAMAPTVRRPASAAAKAKAAAAAVAAKAAAVARAACVAAVVGSGATSGLKRRLPPATAAVAVPVAAAPVRLPTTIAPHVAPPEKVASDPVPGAKDVVVAPPVLTKFKKRRRKTNSAAESRPLAGRCHPNSQRTVEYQCALCNESYVAAVAWNPWWALSQEHCTKCAKLQIPRIDISNPVNGIEYHPALLAHSEEEDRNNQNNNNSSGSHAHPHHLMGSPHLQNDEEDASDASETDDDDDDPENAEDFGAGYEGPVLGEGQARALLLLMDHARTCPGRHTNDKQREICTSTKFLMMHVRDCSGKNDQGEPCIFPWCRKVKHLVSHTLTCKDVLCNVCTYKVPTKDPMDRTRTGLWKNLRRMNSARWEKVDKKWRVAPPPVAVMAADAAAKPSEAGGALPHHPGAPSNFVGLTNKSPVPSNTNSAAMGIIKNKSPVVLPPRAPAPEKDAKMPDVVVSIGGGALARTAAPPQSAPPVAAPSVPVPAQAPPPASVVAAQFMPRAARQRAPAAEVTPDLAPSADPSKPATAALIAASSYSANTAYSGIPESLLSNDGDSFSASLSPALTSLDRAPTKLSRNSLKSVNSVNLLSSTFEPFFNSNQNLTSAEKTKDAQNISSISDMQPIVKGMNKSISVTLNGMTSNSSISNLISSPSISNMMSSQSVSNMMSSQSVSNMMTSQSVANLMASNHSISNLMSTMPSSDGMNFISDNPEFLNGSVDVMDCLLENENQSSMANLDDMDNADSNDLNSGLSNSTAVQVIC